MSELAFTVEQELEAQRIPNLVVELTQNEALRLGRIRSRPDVVSAWDHREVARRWLMLCPLRKDSDGMAAEPSPFELNTIVARTSNCARQTGINSPLRTTDSGTTECDTEGLDRPYGRFRSTFQ
jgi:hypothetical protein